MNQIVFHAPVKTCDNLRHGLFFFCCFTCSNSICEGAPTISNYLLQGLCLVRELQAEPFQGVQKLMEVVKVQDSIFSTIGALKIIEESLYYLKQELFCEASTILSR